MEETLPDLESKQDDLSKEVVPLEEPKRNRRILVVMGSTLMLVGLLGFGAYSVLTYNDAPPTAKLTVPESAIAKPTAELTPKYIGDYEAFLKPIPDPECEGDYTKESCQYELYLRENTTGEEVFVMTDDYLQDDGRFPQYRNGYIFLIKRIGNSTYPSEDWTDELWVYVDQGQGIKLYDHKGLHFLASDDASLLAVTDRNYDWAQKPPSEFDTVIMLHRKDSWQIKKHTLHRRQCFGSVPLEYAGDVEFNHWQDKHTLWGEITGMGAVRCYWKLDLLNGGFSYYPVTIVKSMGGLNPEKLVTVYSDKPIFLDQDSADDWLAKHKTYSLYLYSLVTRESAVIDTFPSDFSPKVDWEQWVSPTRLQYSSPTGLKEYVVAE